MLFLSWALAAARPCFGRSANRYGRSALATDSRVASLTCVRCSASHPRTEPAPRRREEIGARAFWRPGFAGLAETTEIWCHGQVGTQFWCQQQGHRRRCSSTMWRRQHAFGAFHCFGVRVGQRWAWPWAWRRVRQWNTDSRPTHRTERKGAMLRGPHTISEGEFSGVTATVQF